MVQILRDQMRNYQADVSGAIRTGQVAQNVGEWNQVTQSAFKIGETAVKQRISDIMAKQAQETGVQNELQKRAEQADTNIINTQIGQQANIAAQDIIDKEIEQKKLDPYSAAGQNRINQVYTDAYKQHISSMTSEKGRLTLEEMARKGADKSLTASRKTFDALKKEGAMSAANYIDLYNSKASERAGMAMDFDSFDSFTSQSQNAIVDYMVAHGADKDKDTAAAKWRLRQGTNYLIGMAQTQPEEVARIIGIQDREAIEKLVKEQNPKMSKKEVKKFVDGVITSETEATKDKLQKIFGDGVLNSYGDSEELAVSNLQADLKQALGRMVKKGMNQKVLKAQQEEYADNVRAISNIMSPDEIVSANAMMSLVTGGDSFGSMFKDEIDLPDLTDTINTFENNSVKIKEEKYPTTEGTLNIIDNLRGFTFNNESTPAQKTVLALKTMNSIHESPVTQEQYEQTGNVLFNAMADEQYGKQLAETMAKANILDHYAELFSTEMPETDKELQKPQYSTPIASGLMRDWKSKKIVDFNYASASEVNKAKYNLVKDTYAGVLQDAANQDFKAADRKIFELPYNIAFLNYEGKISKDVLAKFMERDLQGNGSVYPEFTYNGFTFQYLGIDPTGTILAKRRL